MKNSDRRNFLRAVFVASIGLLQIFKSATDALAASTPTPSKSSKKPTPTKKSTPTPTPSKSSAKPSSPTTSSTPTSAASALPGLALLVGGKQISFSDFAIGKTEAGTTMSNGFETPVLISKLNATTMKVFSAICPHRRAVVDVLPNGGFQCVQGHGLIFDIKTGAGIQNSYQLSNYEVIIKDNKVFVKPPAE